jgi:hypothetical protein
MQTNSISRRRKLAIIFILITDIGFIAWGGMAALLPENLLGPNSAPIVHAEYEGFTGLSWSALTASTPAVANFMTILFRVYGAYNVAFGIMAVFIALTAFRRGERWAWWALLVGNTITLVSAIIFDRTVKAIGIFEMSEYLGLLIVYIGLGITYRFSESGQAVQSAQFT